MGHITLTMTVLALLGIIIHIGESVMKRENKESKASFRVWISQTRNIWRIILAAASTFVILILAEVIASWMGATTTNHESVMLVVAFAAGYFNHLGIKSLLNWIRNKIKSKTETDEDNDTGQNSG